MNSIFIVGTGRSGTHFLCRSLKDFENIEDYMNGEENHDIRIPLTELALKHKPLSNDIIDYYRKQINKASLDGKIFLDQLHTNLFHVEQLANEFPEAIFLTTLRPTEQIVASMINHSGVRSWWKYALKNQKVVYPNQFLGVDSKEELETLDEITLCVKRINAHNKFSKYLQKSFLQVREVEFTKLVTSREEYLNSIFTEDEKELIGKYTDQHLVQSNVLDKYKEQFTPFELKKIKDLQNV